MQAMLYTTTKLFGHFLPALDEELSIVTQYAPHLGFAKRQFANTIYSLTHSLTQFLSNTIAMYRLFNGQNLKVQYMYNSFQNLVKH